MYFKNIELENIGPIEHLNINFHEGDENPKPMIIVGENGSGKSILLSHLVNCMLLAKQEVFDDTEVEKGKVYKYRSPNYVKSGEYFSYSVVNYTSNLKVTEWQLLLSRDEFEKQLNYTPIHQGWPQIPPNENSHFDTAFRHDKPSTEQIVKNQCSLYFPVNRFEDPAWLNLDNLTAKAKYTELKRISGYSNRNIICTSPLKENKNWLLDLIFDRQAFELHTPQIPLPMGEGQPAQLISIFAGYHGQSNTIYDAVLKLLRVILRESGNIRLGAGTRKNRQISIMKEEQQWIPNLFQLSTGEAQLLNLFLSILRDYDLSDGEFNGLGDVKGIAIIDEIDAHLHTAHQREVLPELIASFPKVQFIITTHSPLFLMGMEEKLGEAGFNIIDMPHGNKIAPSDFSEFIAAHNAFKETEKYREEIKAELERISKPIVFVEGDYDIRYLKKAAEVLGKEEIIEKIEIKDVVGYGNLDKVWKSYNNYISEVLPGKIILIYDCDTNKQNANKNKVYKRVIPSIQDNPISIGIENLFPNETIVKLEGTNSRYIDITYERTDRVRGIDTTLPSSKSVNKDEKGNMCNWLCEHGQVDDFANFQTAFAIIEEILND